MPTSTRSMVTIRCVLASELIECLVFVQAYPFELNWDAIYANTTLPLVVDVGSGKSLFSLAQSFYKSIKLFWFETLFLQ